MWRILYPLEFADILAVKSAREGVDPTLVAALICQESTFDPEALSPAGARGLMQIIPRTGREIARGMGVRFQPRALSDPSVSLDFGTRYLAGLLERYGNRIDRALAAYNAGPHRVDQWTAAEPDMPSEVFIETIPFSETRHYVATVLANQAHYGRIYPLAPRTQAARSVTEP
jgi:soluble lytic murein transglycosylase